MASRTELPGASTGAGSARPLRRAVGVALGLLLAAASVEWWSGLAHLSALYAGLGAPLWYAAAALYCFALCAVAPVVVLLGGWLSRDPVTLGWPWVAASALLLVCGLSVLTSYALGKPTPVPMAGRSGALAALETQLSGLGVLAQRLPRGRGRPGALLTEQPAECDARPSAAVVTLVATHFARGPRAAPLSVCLQATQLAPSLDTLKQWLLEHARRGPLKLDVVSSVHDLGARHAWLDPFKLRPGLDGVCYAQRCLMPWQLLAGGHFSSYRPLSFIADLQFGVDPAQLLRLLGVKHRDASALRRVSTHSYLIDLASPTPRLVPLRRMRRRDVVPDVTELREAARLAEAHVLGAQLEDGRFRYTLSPFDGKKDTRGFNLARQAGAVLALCELSDQRETVNRAVRRGLGVFRRYERRRGRRSVLTHQPEATQARLGENALPLLSLLRCRDRVGSDFDALIGGLARQLLALQRADGGFWRYLDLDTGRPRAGGEPLYASGQIVMSLLLLEEQRQAEPSSAWPATSEVAAAAERAMTHYARHHWTHPLRDYFFLEENWHCLAAREALRIHPHRGYEDFCWEYVGFKARLIQRVPSGANADFDGGFGFGNLVPPHNTGTAGFVEALAAALELRRARGHFETRFRSLLGRSLGFLLRQQWTPQNCAACADAQVVGGLSEHTHSAMTRIDFAQHAWAAFVHGRRVLFESGVD